jgi:hypothetical protein
MEQQVVEKIVETITYVDLSKIYIPVFIACWLNRKLNKYHQKQSNLSDLMAVTVDIGVVANHLANLKRDVSIPRQKEIESLRLIEAGKVSVSGNDIFLNLVKTNPSASFSLVPKFQNIFLRIQEGDISFSIDCNKISFVSKYNPAVLEVVLTLKNITLSVNKIVNELNGYIDKCVDKNSPEYPLMVISVTENLIHKMDTAIAFSDLASEILVDWGRKIFGKEFRIIGMDNKRYNDHNLRGRLPDGWDHLKIHKKPQWHVVIKRKFFDIIW